MRVPGSAPSVCPRRAALPPLHSRLSAPCRTPLPPLRPPQPNRRSCAVAPRSPFHSFALPPLSLPGAYRPALADVGHASALLARLHAADAGGVPTGQGVPQQRHRRGSHACAHLRFLTRRKSALWPVWTPRRAADAASLRVAAPSSSLCPPGGCRMCVVFGLSRAAAPHPSRPRPPTSLAGRAVEFLAPSDASAGDDTMASVVAAKVAAKAAGNASRNDPPVKRSRIPTVLRPCLFLTLAVPSTAGATPSSFLKRNQGHAAAVAQKRKAAKGKLTARASHGARCRARFVATPCPPLPVVAVACQSPDPSPTSDI